MAVPRTSAPPWLIASGAVFLLFTLILVAGSLRRSPPPGYPISRLAASAEPTRLTEERVVTLDARDPDHWARLDLSRSVLVEDADRAAWDVAVRRFRIVVNGGPGFLGSGGAVRLSGRSFDEVSEAPVGGYAGSRVTAGGDTVHSELGDWYRYGFLSHLLEPTDAVYALRTADGKYAKMEVLGYYCPGAEPGCITLRYVLQGDGSRRLTE